MSGPKSETIEIRLPVSAEYLTALRLFVSGLAGRLGYTVEQIDELKLAIGEAFLTLVSRLDPQVGYVRIHWELGQNSLTVTLSDPAGKTRHLTTAPIYRVLDRLVEEGEVVPLEEEGEVRIRFPRPEIGRS